MLPVRCFTCGKVIGNKWELYKKKLDARGDDREDLVLDEMKILRFCCRRMFMGNAEDVEEIVHSYEFLHNATRSIT